MNDSLFNVSVNNGSPVDSAGEPSAEGVEPAPMRWTLRIIFILVFLVGTVGNSVVCAAVIRRKRMWTSSNIFTFNLAFSDLLTVVIYVPSQMTAFENNHNWLLGDFACRLSYTIIPTCMSASIMTLLAITLDRYRAISNPLRSRLKMRTVRIILAGIWITSFLIVLPLVFVAGLNRPSQDKVFCDEINWPEEILSKVYWIFIFAIQYVLPLATIVILAVLIALKIRQNSAEMLKSSNQLLTAARQRMRQTARITNMLVALVILYAVCMLPQHVVYFWMVYGELFKYKYYVYVLRFSNVFPMANSAFNPFAYGLNKEFKQAFQSFFKCVCNQHESPQTNGVSLHRAAGRRFQHSDVYGERLKKWRRKPTATSLLSKAGKKSLWAKKQTRQKPESNSNGVVLRAMMACNGEDEQNSPLLRISEQCALVTPVTPPTTRKAGGTGASQGMSRSPATKSRPAPTHEGKHSTRVAFREQGSCESEMTSLLSSYEPRRSSDKQNSRKDGGVAAHRENSGPNSPQRGAYLEGGNSKVSLTTVSDLLSQDIASSVRLTFDKSEEELVKFIQSLEETNV